MPHLPGRAEEPAIDSSCFVSPPLVSSWQLMLCHRSVTSCCGGCDSSSCPASSPLPSIMLSWWRVSFSARTALAAAVPTSSGTCVTADHFTCIII